MSISNAPKKGPDLRLGALAIQAGYLTPEKLAEVLRFQEDLSAHFAYRRLGDLLVETGNITSEQLDKLLKKQEDAWGGNRVLGRYRLLEKIGQGGMGAVWKARNEELGNTVAIKLLPRAVIQNASLVERFRRETRLLAKANHTNLVQAYDAGEADGQPYFVMPFLDGASVGQVLRKCGQLGVRTTLSIALQIVRGLHYAHEHGMIHRDLKPDNLFIANDGTVKILDLGLTKLMESHAANPPDSSTMHGLVVGTPDYMSPEQILGDRNIDGRSDLYSLGVTLFQMLCGKVPFRESHIPKLLRRKIEEAPPDPKSVRPGLPNGVRMLILRLLARKPEDRPPDCAVLEAEIEALLDGMPVTGSNLAPSNIVLGLSERDTRTFHPRPKNASPLPRSTRKVGPGGAPSSDSTTVMPRPKDLPARKERPTRRIPRSVDEAPASPQAERPPARGKEKKVERPRAASVPPTPPVTPASPTPPTPPIPPVDPALPTAPPRVQVGWVGQLIAAIVLVIITVIVTAAVIKRQGRMRRAPPPLSKGQPR